MNKPLDQTNLLKRLDTLQNETIQALDELNGRIEATIQQWSIAHNDWTAPSQGEERVSRVSDQRQR